MPWTMLRSNRLPWTPACPSWPRENLYYQPRPINQPMRRLRFRLIVLSVACILIIINILVILTFEPSTSDDAGELSARDWEEEAKENGGEPPEVHEDVEGPVPGDEPKS